MKRVYLCSRVAYDARPNNDIVAKSLREAGFEVYVPHEQAPNNLSTEDMEAGRFDKETIFKLDFGAMQQSNVCVVVGRIGKDCSWEIGWFYAKGIPIVHVPCGDETYLTSPMLLPALSKGRCVVPELTHLVVMAFTLPEPAVTAIIWRPDHS